MPGTPHCHHGRSAYSCRDLMPERVRRAVDYAHEHAYSYAHSLLGTSAFPSRDACEQFAAYVADQVARADGALEGINLPSETERWLSGIV